MYFLMTLAWAGAIYVSDRDVQKTNTDQYAIADLEYHAPSHQEGLPKYTHHSHQLYAAFSAYAKRQSISI